jgi:hypothetical protein
MHALFVWVALAPPPEIAPAPRLIDPDRAAKNSLRWVLRFKVENGKDYVDQLRTLGATLAVPNPEDPTSIVLIPDLAMPKEHRVATEENLKSLTEKIRLSDRRKEAVEGVAAQLGLDFTPKQFWAFLPRSIEEELLRKELAYRNRRFEAIEETIFRITIRAGKAEIIVDDQVLKK